MDDINISIQLYFPLLGSNKNQCFFGFFAFYFCISIFEMILSIHRSTKSRVSNFSIFGVSYILTYLSTNYDTKNQNTKMKATKYIETIIYSCPTWRKRFLGYIYCPCVCKKKINCKKFGFGILKKGQKMKNLQKVRKSDKTENPDFLYNLSFCSS